MIITSPWTGKLTPGLFAALFFLADGPVARPQERAARGEVELNRFLITEHVDHPGDDGLRHVYLDPVGAFLVSGDRLAFGFEVDVRNEAGSFLLPGNRSITPVAVLPPRGIGSCTA